MKMLRRHSSVTTPTKEEEASTNNKSTAALLTDDIAIDYTKLSPSRSYMRLDNEDNIATGGGGGGCSRSIIVTQQSAKPTLLARSQSTPTTIPSHNTNNIATTKTIGTINNTLTLKTFDTNTSTPKRNPKISEAFNKINNMASQIKHSQKLLEEQQSIDRDSLWEVVKQIDNGATPNKQIDNSTTTTGNNMESSKLDTTAETTPLCNNEEKESAPSLEWTVDWNLCNTSNNFSANPCGGSATNPCAANNLCGAKECWDNAFPDNDVFACNDFFDLNAATTNNNNNVDTANKNMKSNTKNGQVVIAEEYNEVIEINDKVAADISAGKDDVDGSMSQSLAVVEWLKDEYMASIGATEVGTTLDEKEGTTTVDEKEGKKDLPSSPTSVLDCTQSTLSSSVAEVTTAISSIPTSMCKQETIVSSTIACCGVFDSIVQIPQSFNDVVTCQLFPESSDDNVESGSGGDDRVGSSEVKSDEIEKGDDYKMVKSEVVENDAIVQQELGLKLPKEDSDSSGCDSVVISEDDNSQPSI